MTVPSTSHHGATTFPGRFSRVLGFSRLVPGIASRAPGLLPVVVFTAILGASACHRSDPPAPKKQIQASQLPPLHVDAKAKLLLTYYARSKGTFVTLSQVKDLPEAERGWVRVVDLSAKASRRRDLELVYVADFRAPGKNGAYPYVVMSRRAFEAAAQSGARPGATAPTPAPGTTSQARIIVYGTSWCGACAQARKWLKEKHIPFVDKDIEKDRAAAAELMAKAQKAGIPASGVPVLDVNGTLMRGFNPNRLTALLKTGASK